jgi:hypothetical protein
MPHDTVSPPQFAVRGVPSPDIQTSQARTWPLVRSLSHLAHGITIVSGTGGWQSWALAVAIDLGMAASETAMITPGERVKKDIKWYSASMIAGTLVLSAAMNAFAFAAQATTLPFEIAGVVFGVSVPAAIYVLLRQAAALFLDSRRRS